MTITLAVVVGAAGLVVASVVAMAALSHCPRRLRMWPAMMLAFGALSMSDRALYWLQIHAPLEGVRAALTLGALLAAAGTVVALCWVVTTACPMCRRERPLEDGPVWFRRHVVKRREGGGA